METLFYLCLLIAFTAAFFVVLTVLADYVVDPLLRKFRRER